MRARFAPLLAIAPLLAQAPAPGTDPLAPLRFLVGTWRGEGTGQPGRSVGVATFRFELEGRALVRRSFADAPAAEGRPASRHEDLMTVFVGGGQLRALYLDNEGHVIHYLVAPGPDGVTFTSEAAPGPRFRLSYRRKGEGQVALRFEIAAPAASEAFRTYLEADLRRAD